MVRRVGGQEDNVRAPPLDELLDLLGPVRPQPIVHHHLPLRKRRCQEVLYVSLEKAEASVAPSMVIGWLMAPCRVMAAMSVVFSGLGSLGACRRPSSPSAPSL